jgi:hypothetical protein
MEFLYCVCEFEHLDWNLQSLIEIKPECKSEAHWKWKSNLNARVGHILCENQARMREWGTSHTRIEPECEGKPKCEWSTIYMRIEPEYASGQEKNRARMRELGTFNKNNRTKEWGKSHSRIEPEYESGVLGIGEPKTNTVGSLCDVGNSKHPLMPAPAPSPEPTFFLTGEIQLVGHLLYENRARMREWGTLYTRILPQCENGHIV